MIGAMRVYWPDGSPTDYCVEVTDDGIVMREAGEWTTNAVMPETAEAIGRALLAAAAAYRASTPGGGAFATREDALVDVMREAGELGVELQVVMHQADCHGFGDEGACTCTPDITKTGGAA